jgi:hypothetical protein
MERFRRDVVLVDESVNKVMKQSRGERGVENASSRNLPEKAKGAMNQKVTGMKKKQGKPINRQMKKKIENLDQARPLGLSRPVTRFCKTRKCLGLLQPPPHGLGCNRTSSTDGSDSSGK